MEILNFCNTQNLIVSCVATVVAYCCCRVVNVTWWRPRRLEKHFRKQGLRGTSYTPFTGDMKIIRSCYAHAMSKPINVNHPIVPRVMPFVHQMTQKYGKMTLCWYETKARVIIAEAEAMRSVLTNKNGDIVNPPLNPLVYLLQRGISTLDGPKWAYRRKLITPAFHLDKLKRMMPAFSASCSEVVDEWKKMARSGGDRCEVDVAVEFEKLTGDVISRTLFGSGHEQGKKIFQLQKQQVVLLVDAYQSIYIPGLRFIPTRKNRKRYALDKKIREMLMDMINRKKEDEAGGGDNDDDNLLGLLLKSKDESGNGLTMDDVIEECKLFFFAGQETTATLLTWTMLLLSLNPHWQDLARNEVLQVFGSQKPNYESITHLKIVSMILNEVLRMYPPAPSVIRYAKRDTNIGGMSIPAGVELYLPLLVLHYDPQYWGEDVQKFKPERFAQGAARASTDEMAYYPFGWGPKICPGQNFAMIEVKMALVMILQHFSFNLSPTYAHAPCLGVTLRPQHGVPIILHPI